MSFGQRLIEILNTPVPLPAFLENPDVFQFSYLNEVGERIEKFVSQVKLPVRRRRRPLQVRQVRRSGSQTARPFSLEGMLRSASSAGFCIEGTHFHVNENTFVVGELRSNAVAKVKGICLADGRRVATAVVVREPM